VLLVDKLSFTYPSGRQVFSDISLKIGVGDIVCILGQSGSGKTTFLKCLNVLLVANQGNLSLGGRMYLRDGSVGVDPTLLRKKIGIVFQENHLFPSLKVIDNLLVPQIRAAGLSRQKASNRAEFYSEMFKISHILESYPEAISLGEAKRVALARTLLMEPNVLLLDEPTTGLDIATSAIIESSLLHYIKEKSNRAILFSTHDILLARKLSSSVAFISRKDKLISWTKKEFNSIPDSTLVQLYEQ